MKKQTALNFTTVRALFEAETAGQESDSYFRVNGGEQSVTLNVPSAVMHRLFRLGQAYGIRQLRYFESDVKIVVGSTEMPSFLRDLRRVFDLVNVEVLRHHLGLLITEIESGPGATFKNVAVVTGNYFEKR